MRRPFLSLLIISLFNVATFAQHGEADNHSLKSQKIDGYPIANFAIAANFSQSGEFYNNILRNPGQIGKWLESYGKVSLSLQIGDENIRFSDFSDKEINREFPIVSFQYRNHPLTEVRVQGASWAPIRENHIDETALPLIQLDLQIDKLPDQGRDAKLLIETSGFFGGAVNISKDGHSWMCSDGVHALVSNGEIITIKSGVLAIPLSNFKNSATIHLALILSDNQWHTASSLGDLASIGAYVMENWNKLRSYTQSFNNKLPDSGDKELNTLMRAYVVPGMILTKCTSGEEVLTMGYRELNQRDSYWTSWLHLIMFPDLEKKMIAESAVAIRADGKVPTTILPLIERDDDLDINAFFILRYFRYINHYNDEKFALMYWKEVQLAMNWLITRDKENEGLPQQKSFWGDWKDVQGVIGRKYSPFTGFLYLAALKECKDYAIKTGDKQAAKAYKVAYDLGYELLNKSDDDGGLWTGTHYRQVWYDGRNCDKILQDQTIGAFYGIMPEDRAEKVFETLNHNNLGRFGIAETYPYYPAEFGYKPATYHNGAVWPWLSFMDIWARLKNDRKDEAIDLIKRVGRADILDADFLPNEHINSLTGENLGFFMQGWNADLFGVFWFELNKNEKRSRR